jgi:hypothetical protein
MRQKFLAFFDGDRLEFRLESWTHPPWRWRCAALDRSKPFPQWEPWRETTLESAKRSAKATAERLTSSAVELQWRDLSDMEDESWDRVMREKRFTGWPTHWNED